MKRSKIFLGLTTACLAIAGIVAAKASHFGTAQSFYYTAGGKFCLLWGTSDCNKTSSSTLPQCVTQINSIVKLYTSLTTVQHKLCRAPLTYSDI